MSAHKVECKCCGKMMVPKVITSAPFYLSGIPIGGRKPCGSVCPFCQSSAWMITEDQAEAGAQAVYEFAVILVGLIVNGVILAKYGIWIAAFTSGLSVFGFIRRKDLLRALGFKC